MKTLLLIDANSLIHRAFHALPPLTAPGGRAIQAIYGLGSIFLKLFREEKPDYAAACFDRPEPTFRKEKYEAYKAQRPKAPDELISQIIEAHGFFGELGVKTFEKAGYEADDVIATLAEKFRHIKDLRVVILTGDLDTLQLVKDGEVAVRTFKKGISDTMIYDEAAVHARYGLRPDQLPDYKAFVGDQSDNVKGVSGVGPKTASELLQKYGTLQEIYAHIGDDAKIFKKLSGTEEQAQFSKSLVVLERNVPIDIGDIATLAIADNAGRLAMYFRSLGFESLVKRMGISLEPTREEHNPLIEESAQGSVFGKESNGVRAGDDAIFIAEDEEKGARKAYASHKLKIGFGLKDILKRAWERGENLAPPYFDLGVAFWLLEPDLKRYDPASLIKHFLRHEWTGNVDEVQTAYAFVEPQLRERGVEKLCNDIEMPVLEILAEMERAGVLLDREALSTLGGRIQKELSVLEEQIHAHAGEPLNPNSPKQVAAFLERVAPGRNGGRKTPTGKRSTRAENLELFRDVHPAIGPLLEYREAFKVLSTYVRPFEELIASDGRLHTTFVQTGAGTGRMSSQNPNLQNIPRDSVWASDLRSTIVSRAGYTLLAVDYSQIELRILAALSGDAQMLSAFRAGADIHRTTASKVFRVPLENVTPKMRQLAKTLNFGLIYGMGASAFQRTSGVSREEATKFIHTYFDEFSAVHTWHEKVKRDVRTFGYVETPTGRRRYLPDVLSGSPQYVAAAERAAINHPVQGFAADLMKLAMIRVKRVLQEQHWWQGDAVMLLTIHDELLFEVRDGIINEVMRLVRDAMEHAYDLAVPLVADVRIGKSWGTLREHSVV